MSVTASSFHCVTSGELLMAGFKSRRAEGRCPSSADLVSSFVCPKCRMYSESHPLNIETAIKPIDPENSHRGCFRTNWFPNLSVDNFLWFFGAVEFDARSGGCSLVAASHWYFQSSRYVACSRRSYFGSVQSGPNFPCLPPLSSCLELTSRACHCCRAASGWIAHSQNKIFQ